MSILRVLFDTNVVLDDLLDRQPFADDAYALTAHVEEGRLNGVLCATTLTTIYYITSRSRSEDYARRQAYDLVRLFDIAPVNESVLSDAFNLRITDYEDAVIHEAARLAEAEAIVTRNQRDFVNASLQIYTPSALLTLLSALGNA